MSSLLFMMLMLSRLATLTRITPRFRRLFLVLSILAASPAVLTAQDDGVEATSEEFVVTEEALELAPEVLALFDRSCAYCHDETQRRPKGDFGFILDLDRLRQDPDYIVPGDAMDSEVYLLIIDPDEEFVMPPPESDQPMLTEEEADKVKAWINGGAPPVPTVAQVTDTTDEPEAGYAEIDEAEELPEKKKFVLKTFIARLHPLLVHFPIGLLLFGVLAEIARQVRPGAHYEVIVTWSLFFGTLGALASVGTGWWNADVSGYSDAKVFLHRWSGVSVLILGALAWVLQMRLLRHDSVRNRLIFWLVLLFVAIAVSIAGHTGGELVYGENYLFS